MNLEDSIVMGNSPHPFEFAIVGGLQCVTADICIMETILYYHTIPYHAIPYHIMIIANNIDLQL